MSGSAKVITRLSRAVMRVGTAAAAMAAAVGALPLARRRSGDSPDAGCADGGRSDVDGTDEGRSDADCDGRVAGCLLLTCMLYFLDFRRFSFSSGQIG